MMRKGTGAAFVIMPDDREGKMVLEYVRWWHQLTFSYFSKGINKLLTFKALIKKGLGVEVLLLLNPLSLTTEGFHFHILLYFLVSFLIF